MVTTEEADKFLTNQLKFTNWKEVLEKDNLDFLKLLVPYYAHNIYFQNIRLSSVPVASRKVPDERDIIEAGLNGVGGNCITQNSFLTLLLKALGFNAFIISGTVFDASSPIQIDTNNHVLCIVRLKAEEMYLLDLGVGIPFAEPVPIHNLPYVNRAVGNRYLYRKSNNGFYECVQLDGALIGEKYANADTEYVRYNFSLEPRTIGFFEEPLTDIFMNPDKSIFLQFPLLFRYFAENEAGEMLNEAQTSGDRKFILIRGKSVLIGTNETKFVEHVDNFDDLKDTILKYFPKFKKEDVKKSLQCFNKNAKA